MSLSLVADYGSSSEDEQEVKKSETKTESSSRSTPSSISETPDEDDEELDQVVFKSDSKPSTRKEIESSPFSIFASLPKPKRSKEESEGSTEEPTKKKVTVPISLKKAKLNEEEEEEDADTNARPAKRTFNTNSGSNGGLSFLPAPKNEIPKSLFDNAVPKPKDPKTTQNTNDNSTNVASKPTKTVAPLPNDFFDDGDSSMPTQSTESAKPTSVATENKKPLGPTVKKSVPARVRMPLSFKQQPQVMAALFKEDEKESEEATNNNQSQSIPQYEEQAQQQQQQQYPEGQYYTEQQQQEYYYNNQGYYNEQYNPAQDPNYAAYYQYQQQLAEQSNDPRYHVPKEFRGAIGANMIEINATDIRNHNRPRYNEPVIDFFPKDDLPQGEWTPSKDHKRQNHASYLLYELKNKLPQIEAKRAEGARAKKEAKAKYGW